MAMKILYSCLSKSWGNMELDTLTAVKNLLDKNLSAELLCHTESRIHIEANNMGFIQVMNTINPSSYQVLQFL